MYKIKPVFLSSIIYILTAMVPLRNYSHITTLVRKISLLRVGVASG